MKLYSCTVGSIISKPWMEIECFVLTDKGEDHAEKLAWESVKHEFYDLDRCPLVKVREIEINEGVVLKGEMYVSD